MKKTLIGAWLLIGLAIGAAAAPPAAGAAAAQEVTPGEYVTEQGWGVLRVSPPDAQGRQRLELSATGANGHDCGWTGTLQGPVANVDDGACIVHVESGPGRLGLTVAEPQNACRDYCGARAWFEGDYFIPPAGCSSREREQARAAFNTLYRARSYAAAQARLDPMFDRCGRYLTWLEDAQVRNDLAITLHHLHRDAECIALEKKLIPDGVRSEDEVEGALELPPADKDSFEPLARAAFHNATLCGWHPAK
jgi:hypothetical protein